MQILEFVPTRADHRDRVRATAPHWHDFSLRWTIAAAIGAGAITAIAEEMLSLEIDRIAFAIALLGLIAAIGVGAREITIRRRVAAWTAPAGPTRIEVGEDRIVMIEDGRRRTQTWEGLIGVSIDERLVMLHAEPETASVAVPARAFADRAAMIAFFGLAEERIGRDDEDDDTKATLAVAPDRTFAVTVGRDGDDRATAALRQRGAMSFDRAALATTIGGGAVSAATVVVGGAVLGRGFDPVIALAAAWIGATGTTWWGARRVETARRKAVAEAGRRIGAQVVTIDASGVTRTGRDVEARLGWAAIDRIEVRDGCVVLATAWGEAIVAPRRCFADDDAFADFEQAARAHRRVARAAARNANTAPGEPDAAISKGP